MNHRQYLFCQELHFVFSLICMRSYSKNTDVPLHGLLPIPNGEPLGHYQENDFQISWDNRYSKRFAGDKPLTDTLYHRSYTTSFLTQLRAVTIFIDNGCSDTCYKYSMYF